MPYLQPYAYVNNNPINNVDPSGQFAVIATVTACALYAPCGVAAAAVIATLAGLLMDCVMQNVDSAWIPDCQPLLEQLRQAEADFMRGVAGAGATARDYATKGYNWLASAEGESDPRTAGEITAQDKKGRINQKFPDQWRDKTLDEIEEAAKRNLPGAKRAQKLLTDKKYDKHRR